MLDVDQEHPRRIVCATAAYEDWGPGAAEGGQRISASTKPVRSTYINAPTARAHGLLRTASLLTMSAGRARVFGDVRSQVLEPRGDVDRSRMIAVCSVCAVPGRADMAEMTIFYGRA